MPKRVVTGLGLLSVLAAAGVAWYAQSLGPGAPPLSSSPIKFKDDAPANAAVAADKVPLRFTDRDGKPFDLGQYRGAKNVVLVVLRGQVCQYCDHQTAGLVANADEFPKRDAVVVVVYPGPPGGPDGTDRLVARAEADGGRKWSFPLLLDPDCTVCDALDIRGRLAKPSTYILDKRGEVVYAYVGANDADRPSVKAVLAHLDKLNGR